MIDNLPGYQVAVSLGYELHSYSGNHQSAYYVKDHILHLKVSSRNGMVVARLEATARIILLTTGEFTFPHPHFDRLEQDMAAATQAVRQALDTGLSPQDATEPPL